MCTCAGAVPAASAKPAAAGKAAQPARGRPSKVLKQSRWEIENFVGGDPIELDDVKRDQTLYIAHCSDTVIQVCSFMHRYMSANRGTACASCTARKPENLAKSSRS